MRIIKRLVVFIAVIFVLPSVAAIGWWQMIERPASWRQADWSSSGILPPATQDSEAVIHIMAARTGGLKGALSVHSWIVTKAAGADRYNRYDKVGWGPPVRMNAYAADARWYSNTPFFVKTVRGEAAERLIPEIEAVIAVYPHAARGGYTIWPGPNSNTFVAHILRQVPQLDAVLPPAAVGRDYLADGDFVFVDPDSGEFKLTWGGLIGVSAGRLSGFEMHFLGAVAGIDIRQPAIKLPGFGRIGLPGEAVAATR